MYASGPPIFRQFGDIGALVRSVPALETRKADVHWRPRRARGVRPDPSPLDWVNAGQKNASACMDEIHQFRRRSGLLILMARATNGADFSFVFPYYASSERKS